MIDKLFIYIVSILIIITAGSSNIYPIYLQHLVDKFNFSVNIINLYGSFVTLGGWLGFPIGLIYDYYGPKIASIIGTLLLSSGYYFLHLILSHDKMETVNVVLLLLLGFILGQGNYLLYTSAVGTSLKNFNFKQNSSALGILLSMTAAAPSLFSTCRQIVDDSVSDESFYFYLSMFILLMGGLSILVLNKKKIVYSLNPILRKYEKYKEKKVLYLMVFYNLIIIILFIIGILINYYKSQYIFPLLVIFPVLLMLNIVFVFFVQCGLIDKLYKERFKVLYEELKHEEIEMAQINSLKSMENIPQDNIREDVNKEVIKNKKEKFSSLDVTVNENEEKIEILPIIKDRDFIMLFIIVFFGLGSVISNMSNLNFILKSISYKIHYSGINKGVISIYKEKEVYFYVILYFIFNSLTRIICSLYIDVLIKKRKINIYLVYFSLIGVVSQLLGIPMNKKLLYISISLAGSVHGAYVIFLPSFIQIRYGLNSIGSLFGILLTAGGLGSFGVSETAFSFPYSYFAEKGDIIQCIGKKCFSYSYLISSFLFGINTILAIIITCCNSKKDK